MSEQLSEKQSEKQRLVRQAETLAYSNDWRNTARTMRHMRRQWQEIESAGEFQNDQLSIRFRLALQTFLDRRADYFQRGHQAKGVRIQEKITEIQRQSHLLRDSIQKHRNTLQDYDSKRQSLVSQPHRKEVESFIHESIQAVSQEMENQEQELQALEQEIQTLTTQFHGV